MGLLAALTDPDIGKHLLREEGEVIVDEVRHHWVAFIVPGLVLLAALALLVAVPFIPLDWGWFPLLLALGVGVYGGYRALGVHMDRFVITNMRVFRVHGVFSQQLATMPLTRILDITVKKPLIGRILGYGHFVFESAAQAQGLRDIRTVARPDERDMAIQRVVQRSGVRGRPQVN
ncbi:putative membrane protein YdbT with pleckstrin-like domain [Nocardioides zeae]|uniref:Membrane protein YdbT with pleckstrin-like domain n=1 Tax=Nocardioides zeae TaxID=1457234 RepID=A0ACC6IH13_9ACTN|nr:PH domain-containing protein [Nocardioides zeae]MDR6172913.1 putative membrane protein YdbT with pleckstrin-like domain [Nocardioides zeae]MDR6209907.1 putative membrane protein YdbT with pleckstrin-like domain [Nocardioides zeae]